MGCCPSTAKDVVVPPQVVVPPPPPPPPPSPPLLTQLQPNSGSIPALRPNSGSIPAAEGSAHVAQQTTTDGEFETLLANDPHRPPSATRAPPTPQDDTPKKDPRPNTSFVGTQTAIVFVPSVAAVVMLRCVLLAEGRRRAMIETECHTETFFAYTEALKAAHTTDTESVFSRTMARVSELHEVSTQCIRTADTHRREAWEEYHHGMVSILVAEEGCRRRHHEVSWQKGFSESAADGMAAEHGDAGRRQMVVSHALMALELSEITVRRGVRGEDRMGRCGLVESFETDTRFEIVMLWADRLSDFAIARACLDADQKVRVGHRAAYLADLAATHKRRAVVFLAGLDKERAVHEAHLLREHQRTLKTEWDKLRENVHLTNKRESRLAVLHHENDALRAQVRRLEEQDPSVRAPGAFVANGAEVLRAKDHELNPLRGQDQELDAMRRQMAAKDAQIQMLHGPGRKDREPSRPELSAFAFAASSLSRSVHTSLPHVGKAAEHARRLEALRCGPIEGASEKKRFAAPVERTPEETLLAELGVIRSDKTLNAAEAKAAQRQRLDHDEKHWRGVLEREEAHERSTTTVAVWTVGHHHFTSRREGLVLIPRPDVKSPAKLKADHGLEATKAMRWGVEVSLVGVRETAARDKILHELDGTSTAFLDMHAVGMATVRAHDRRRAGHVARAVDHKGIAAVKIQRVCRGWGTRWQVRAWRDEAELPLTAHHERMQRKYLLVKENLAWHDAVQVHEGMRSMHDPLFRVTHTLDYVEESVRDDAYINETAAFEVIAAECHASLREIRERAKPLEVLERAARRVQKVFRGHRARRRLLLVVTDLRLRRARLMYYGVSGRLVDPLEHLGRQRIEEEAAAWWGAIAGEISAWLTRCRGSAILIQKNYRRFYQQRKYNDAIVAALKLRIAKSSVNKMIKT